MSYRAPIYEAFFRLVLRRLDAERAHHLAAGSLRLLAKVPGFLWLLRRLLAPVRPQLRTRALGLEFSSPLGVAAGVDKDGSWFAPLLALGFGSVEVGTVTAMSQLGNQRPRVTRLPTDRALLNAMGFPNQGAERVAARLAATRPRGVLGVNIGKSKAVAVEEAVADYRIAARELARHADYLAINVSSPNTPGLRSMQSTDLLSKLVDGMREQLRADGNRELPLLVKVAPDLGDEELVAVAELAVAKQLDGIIAVNTTVDHGLATSSAAELAACSHGGGLSGRPLRPRALAVLELLRATVGDQIALISVGGVESGLDVWQRILAGASLVQVYSGFIYGGPLWPWRVNRELARLVRESPWATVAEAVGQGSGSGAPASG